MPPAFDLSHFILRAQALALYRQALRSVRRAPPDARGGSGARHSSAAVALTLPADELRAAVRSATNGARKADTTAQVKFLLAEGKLQLRKLNEMLGLLSSEAEQPPGEPPGDPASGGCGKHAH